jgi:hypothetical protein
MYFARRCADGSDPGANGATYMADPYGDRPFLTNARTTPCCQPVARRAVLDMFSHGG